MFSFSYACFNFRSPESSYHPLFNKKYRHEERIRGKSPPGTLYRVSRAILNSFDQREEELAATEMPLLTLSTDVMGSVLGTEE